MSRRRGSRIQPMAAVAAAAAAGLPVIPPTTERVKRRRQDTEIGSAAIGMPPGAATATAANKRTRHSHRHPSPVELLEDGVTLTDAAVEDDATPEPILAGGGSSTPPPVASLEQTLGSRLAALDERITILSQGRTRPLTDVVNVNVGGTVFTTRRSTLCSVKGSFLESLFSGRFTAEVDRDGCVFIDRDPELFRAVLAYLRDRGAPHAFALNDPRMMHELDYYGLRDEVHLSSNHPPPSTNPRATLIHKWFALPLTLLPRARVLA
jgi:BTB/POZ domain